MAKERYTHPWKTDNPTYKPTTLDRFCHRGKELIAVLIRRDDFVRIEAITMGYIYIQTKTAVLSVDTDGKLKLRSGEFMDMPIRKSR